MFLGENLKLRYLENGAFLGVENLRFRYLATFRYNFDKRSGVLQILKVGSGIKAMNELHLKALCGLNAAVHYILNCVPLNQSKVF